jgi:hypothetical protein
MWKVKVPLTEPKAQRRVDVPLYSFLTSALEGSGLSESRPGHFTPRKDPVPIVQEAGWAPGPVWTYAKNLASTGIRSPDRPALSNSLYRLSSPGSYVLNVSELIYLWISYLFKYIMWCVVEGWYVCQSKNVGMGGARVIKSVRGMQSYNQETCRVRTNWETKAYIRR